MKETFDKASDYISKYITEAYSTSFSKGISLLGSSIQPKIYAIYGFVRLADEIVDSFEGYCQEELLAQLVSDYKYSIKHGISINPVLNSFQKVVCDYELLDLVTSFLESMEMDLNKKDYTSIEQYQKYIYGSAEVVGLMCLKVFVVGDIKKYEELKPYAIKLGSAFQKVNFLRDIQDDMLRLGRTYFPNVNWNDFTEIVKEEILEEVRLEFEEAAIGVKMLPANCKLGVFVAYTYYLSLLKKLSKKSAQDILDKRTRVPDVSKLYILHKSQLQYKLGLL
ncbi:squalene/phytoene synthase family protein [Bacteroidia bacterium]|nr:squalene/phytoene synthase family protein [Bacteroidia bacterium]MDB9883292.1 squalene/phytoene synthase family protein [Bacteroidia bacterium]MDC1395658.1 squalene/phytoene synthase family protein [Bacteroidia bacterium]